MVMKEAMRYSAPAPTSQFYYVKKDVKVGDYNLKQNDMVVINIEALHSDPDQWQRPNEFLPQRHGCRTAWSRESESENGNLV